MPRMTRREKILEKAVRRNGAKGVVQEAPRPLQFVCGGLVLTEEQAPAIASEVDGAFRVLLAGNSHAIWQFEHTFNHRLTLPCCVSTREDRALGICGELAGIFTGRFDKVEMLRNNWEHEMPDKEFVSDFRQAVQILGEEHPIALLFLKRNQLNLCVSLEEALVALFEEYFQRKDVLPY